MQIDGDKVMGRPGKSREFGNVIPGKRAALSGKGEGKKKEKKERKGIKEKKEKKMNKRKRKKQGYIFWNKLVRKGQE